MFFTPHLDGNRHASGTRHMEFLTTDGGSELRVNPQISTNRGDSCINIYVRHIN